jgi:sulfonate transport system permease protein
MKGRTGNAVKSLAVLAALLGVWALVSRAGLFSAYVLPGPGKVWKAFLGMAASGELLRSVLASLSRVLIGFGISFALAFGLGVAAGLFPRANPYYRHILEFLRHVPPMSLIPLLILWFGIGETSKIIIIVLTAFFPIFLNTNAGLAGCDPKLIEVGEVLGMSGAERFFKIRLPAALPSVLVGMRIGLGYSWRAIVGAEMVAAASGLGYMILDAQALSRSDKVIVGILLIGLIGFATDALFALAIRRLTPGGGKADE